MSKAKLNYWVDIAVGLTGLTSAVTGLVLLLPAGSTGAILGISLRLWSSMHTWSSVAAVAGVGVHLALHWKWATAMTGQLLAANRPETAAASTGPVPAAAGGSAVSRRTFLALGGATAVAVGLAAAGYKVIAQAASGGQGEDDGTASLGGGATTGSAQAGGVACPRGLVNDPYPGQCRHYIDLDGDGICDYSIAGSGSQVAGSSGGAFAGRPGGPGRP